MRQSITITLSHDEALVLLEFFRRFDDTDDFTLRHNAEYIAFAKISAQLDKSLVEVFDPRYEELTCAAQERLAAGYEGRAPGVHEGAE